MKRFCVIAAIFAAFLALGPLEAGVAATKSPLSVSPHHLDFTATVGNSDTQTVTITNESSTKITFDRTIALQSPFSFGASDCFSPKPTLNAGKSCTVEIVFSPTATGVFNAKWGIGESTFGTSKQVSLTGIAT